MRTIKSCAASPTWCFGRRHIPRFKTETYNASTPCSAQTSRIYMLESTMNSESPTGSLNRLAHATSPYLLQHAHNPVDWWPWSDEALELARTEDKPIFLSIGYSACHWCHVMAHESFE